MGANFQGPKPIGDAGPSRSVILISEDSFLAVVVSIAESSIKGDAGPSRLMLLMSEDLVSVDVVLTTVMGIIIRELAEETFTSSEHNPILF